MKHLLPTLGLITAIGQTAAVTPPRPANSHYLAVKTWEKDTLDTDTLTHPRPPMLMISQRLTEKDYQEVADRLGVEVAAIKAVVDIEAGKSHEGFSKSGRPLISFDLSMFRRQANKLGFDLSKYNQTHSAVFGPLNVRNFGSTQAAEHHRLRMARTINEEAAIKGTFWGMFQIGGFNWKLCGAESLKDFVEKMSRSERDQLELFANFIVSTGLDKSLRAKNWSAFARGYNGPAYTRHSYHTRLANAYARHRKTTNNLKGVPKELTFGLPGKVELTPAFPDTLSPMSHSLEVSPITEEDKTTEQ